MKKANRPNMAGHSESFIRVRDALLELEDGDRLPIARLFGAMQHPERDLSAGALQLLRVIVTLDDDGLQRLQYGFGRT